MSDLAEQRKMYQEVIDKLEEENKKLNSEIENMKEVGRENIETLDRMSIELENYSKSFKRYRDFSKQELADSLYDAEEQNKKLEERIRFLEQRLDNKEKVNEEYRKEIDRLQNLLSDVNSCSESYREKMLMIYEELGKFVMGDKA